MLATETPQQSVNAARPRPATCDIVIVILWSRMGTPLPDHLRKPNGQPYLSGTEWEYEDAVNSPHQARPAVLVYRRTEKPKVELDDADFADKAAQFQRVKAFFAQFRNADGSLKRGLNDYANPSDFKRLPSQHLQEMLYRRLQPATDDVEPTPTTAEIPTEYSDWLRRSLEKIERLGAKEGRAVTLNHVYVPPLTRAYVPLVWGSTWKGKRARQKQREEEEPIWRLSLKTQETDTALAAPRPGILTCRRPPAPASPHSADGRCCRASPEPS